MKRGAVVLVATATFAVAAALPAEARVPGRGVRQRLRSAVSQPLASSPVRGSLPGILVLRAGAPVLSLNEHEPLTPASLTKIATTTAALARFGPAHRFVTRIVGPPPVAGVVHGSITLVGGGDPTFATAAFAEENFEPKPNDTAPVTLFSSGRATVEALAAALARAGVRRVTGGVIVDESRFDAERIPPGWLPSYQKKGSVEAGNLSGATINLGLADLKGDVVAASPAAVAGHALFAALAKAGVRVAGAVRIGDAPAKSAELASIQGPTVSDIVFWINRFSVNYGAEMLLKNLGASFGGAGTTAAGVAVLTKTLSGLAIPLDGLHLEDGSGLSLLDRMTPATIAALVTRALADTGPAGAALRSSFPVAGEPGTLAKRMKAAPAWGNLRGKTGLLRGVRAMAGWVTAADASTIVYVALFNHVSQPSLLTGALDLIGLTLARFPYL